MGKKRYGIVSYNMYGNFTNYGSALQTYALQRVINSIAPDKVEAIVLDYCPDHLLEVDTLNPMKNMWDKDEESRRLCELMKPMIKVNYEKFLKFFGVHYQKSKKAYTKDNFEQSWTAENLDGYICGSDTIFCVDEGGFDRGFFAAYDCMQKGRSVAYAASFGDTTLNDSVLKSLSILLKNFRAISLRENEYKEMAESMVETPIYKVIDPTLLLTPDDYDEIVCPKQEDVPYLLMYSRRYNPEMEQFARDMAKEKGLKLVEISIRAENARNNEMRYDAGVEEFLSLVKHAEMVVTNSFHGMIFSVQFSTPFYVFGRELGNSKITEVLELFGLSDRLLQKNEKVDFSAPDYTEVHERISKEREKSIEILKKMIEV